MRLHPVNSGGSFTGNCCAFAEYRVSPCGIWRRVSANRQPSSPKETVMMKIKAQSELAKFLMLACVVGLCGTAFVAQAEARDPTAASTTVIYPVRYSDLDLSKMKGAKILYLRIRYAAEMVCESAATWGKREGEACVHKAVNDAVARVNAPLLTQYSELRRKGDKAGLLQLAKTN
jgi:UrcA family protein